MAQKKQISYVSYMRNKRELDALYAMGYRYDMEKDPEKKAALEAEIIKRCDKLKPKLGLKDLSDEEARKLLGVSASSTTEQENSEAVAGQEKAAADNLQDVAANGSNESCNEGDSQELSEK